MADTSEPEAPVKKGAKQEAEMALKLLAVILGICASILTAYFFAVNDARAAAVAVVAPVIADNQLLRTEWKEHRAAEAVAQKEFKAEVKQTVNEVRQDIREWREETRTGRRSARLDAPLTEDAGK